MESAYKRRKPNITLDPKIIESAKIRAKELGMSFSDFVSEAIRRELKRLRAAPKKHQEKELILSFPQAVPSTPLRRAHIMAAAGSPITAEVMEWENEDGKVLVRISGLSMAPKLNDGDVIEMRHKSTARSPFMKKGLVYLLEYDGGYTVKRYNTRKATAEEMGEEWVENGKVKILESVNPEYPEIVIKDQVEWIAWLDEKGGA